jgi:hypothetical protein
MTGTPKIGTYSRHKWLTMKMASVFEIDVKFHTGPDDTDVLPL